MSRPDLGSEKQYLIMVDLNDLLRIQVHDNRELVLAINDSLHTQLQKIKGKIEVLLMVEEKYNYFYLRREEELNVLTWEGLEWALDFTGVDRFITYKIDNNKIKVGWNKPSNDCYDQIIALSSNDGFREKLQEVFGWELAPCYKEADLGLYAFSQTQDRWRTEGFIGSEENKRVAVFVDIDDTLLDRLATYNKGETILFTNVINKLKGLKRRYPQTEFFIITARTEPSTPGKWQRGNEFSTFSVLNKLREEGIEIEKENVIFTSYWKRHTNNDGGEIISKGAKIDFIEEKLREKKLSVRPDFIAFFEDSYKELGLAFQKLGARGQMAGVDCAIFSVLSKGNPMPEAIHLLERLALPTKKPSLFQAGVPFEDEDEDEDEKEEAHVCSMSR
ncbi:Dot/Icm T4SS effector CetCB4 [Coxiella burnetii]|uniref:Dot/Icm T4SS effector CetCB4 n=1 Tax=Coxiella burnetii TaxID=777 RepID=UPI00222EB3CC|nr:Dot/Icm T4SS effector CetCB4 [Coxiella burnetii]